MKVAVRRYSLSLQTEHDSKVGGGRLTSAVLNALVQAGHDVTVTGKAGKLTQQWFALQPIQYSPQVDLSGFDACVILTGPRNSLYDTLHETYASVQTLKRGSRAVYCQWDRALPFAFRPDHDAGLAKHGASWKHISHVQWHLLSQLTNERVRATKGESLGYRNELTLKHHRCLFELEEYTPKVAFQPVVRSNPLPAIAYFGSDRPGRLTEFKRWFCRPGAPPVHVYGGWSEASKTKCASPNVEFRPPVPEESVRAMLNTYRCTLYLADPAYVKDDFVAGRFFENAMAGVPTLYSDKLQPSLMLRSEPVLLLRDPSELDLRFALLDDAAHRARYVAANRRMVDAVARDAEPYRLQHALAQALA